ncbi:hypothetical protein Kfla_6213 [Kribbella flavida DSM 17836]|uniref:Uncharacterized protein n=1 Tax=Kribbella flavida (strain DSM 17836 / JCM 10339 / NBRC 14399) TaxID=479435 RepID=D2PVH6_KRIFD|nr:hypothetical protein [Kribbella flavida]ADB35216.1 hypothetical protein Kfla_6213 [Kribbella flavida DSM 17836]
MDQLIRVAEAPELHTEAGRVFREDWPEFIFHDEGVPPYADRRAEYFADWEFYLVAQEQEDAEPDPADGWAGTPGDADATVGPGTRGPDDVPAGRRLIAGCWGVALAWDGTVADLPGGYTDSLARAVTQYERGVVPNTFVLMAAAVRTDEQAKGRAGQLITAVRDRAVAAGLTQVIAPVRPTLKSRYPLTDIATFMTWIRADGLPLDPWLRTHVRLGATLLAPAPTSQTMTGTVADWESWTGMPFPSTGTYVIPDGLSVLHINHDRNTGDYQEPNIWVRHA